MGELIRTVLWHRPDLPAFEKCRLVRGEDTWSFDGVVVGRYDDAPFEVRYAVECAGDWTTRRAHARIEHRGAVRERELCAEAGRWTLDGEPLDEMDGLIDVDLGFTPCSNTLPIRRLGLGIGESAPTTTVWVRFPDLEVLQLPQLYTRVADRVWRYESRGGEFEARLDVDEHGLVIDYDRWWRRIAASPPDGDGR